MIDSEEFMHILPFTGWEIREAHLIVLPVHRPEVSEPHLAALLAASLDRGLVHRLHTTCSDRIELRVINGLQREDRLLTQLCQPRSADFDATVLEALVLSI